MQIVFNTINHNTLGQRSLEDVIAIMGHQLKALGHQPIFRKENDQFVTHYSGVNIIIEGFTPSIIDVMRLASEQGAKFVILATEEPTDRGFNHGTQKEMVWRQELFPHAAKYCQGIIHLVPGDHVTKWFSQFAPSAFADLGYAPTLMRCDPRIVPEYEYGFYGSLTPRRKRVLKRLAKMIPFLKETAVVRIVPDFRSGAERDEIMQQCKVILQVRKFEEMGLVSSSRCATALSIGRPVVPEPHNLSHPWDEVIQFPQSMDFFYTLALRARLDWQGLYREQLEKFMHRMSPINCLGRALETVGISSPSVSAVRAAA